MQWPPHLGRGPRQEDRRALEGPHAEERCTRAYGAALAALLVIAAPAFGASASKNVELLDNLPEAKNATAINFLSYGKGQPT